VRCPACNDEESVFWKRKTGASYTDIEEFICGHCGYLWKRRRHTVKETKALIKKIREANTPDKEVQ
jgi:transposase-like protein